MAPVPFPVSSAPGLHAQEGAGRLINAYAVKTEQGARSPFKWIRSAGLSSLVTAAGYTGYRGFIELNGGVIAALGQRAFGITKSGSVYTATDLGNLPGTGIVTIAKNNKTPTPDIVCVIPGEGCYNLFAGSAPTLFADTDLGQPNSVAVLDGYFIWTLGDGRIFASDLNAITVNSLSYTTAQKRSDALLRGVTHRGEFYAFGTSSCEVYVDRGLTPFPLEFATMIPRGLAGRNAVAGWEEGWSNDLLWAADDDTVCLLNGYNPEVVSNEDVSRDIAATPDKSVLEASVYMANGTPFWTLTRPGFWTWEINLRTKTWNERKSYGAESWRIARTVKAFQTWVAGDRATGSLFEISPTTYAEGTDALVYEIVSGAVASPPNAISAPRLDTDMTAALGAATGATTNETNPQIEISWSRDGGATYGTPILRALGVQGDYKKQVGVNSLGLAGPKGFRIKYRGADPVPYCLMGATISGPDLRAP